MCDPLYLNFIENVEGNVRGGADIIRLGKGNLHSQARQALKALSDDDDHYRLLLSDFFVFVAAPHEVLVEPCMKAVLPFHAWGQVKGEYKHLAPLMIQVYKAPASTAGVERQHKVGKRVHTSSRNRSGDGKVERQTAIVHNDSCLARQLGTDRQPFELFMAESMSLKPDDIDSDINNSNGDEDDMEQEAMFLRFAYAENLLSLNDALIFRTQDDEAL